MKVLMVCLGNICRSPLAEGILKTKAAEKNLEWTIESRGTGSWHIGEQADPRSIAEAKKNGIDITDQRGQQLQKSDLQEFDLIYAMDTSNYNNILKLASSEEERQKVKMILNESKPNMNQVVPDPYWSDDGFSHVFELLEEACEIIVEKYR